jgi:undecaprenyl-diphosphatase
MDTVDRTTDAPAPLRPLPLAVAGAGLLVLAGALGLWLFVRGNEPFAVDVWWNDVLADAWSPFLSAFSLAMNFLGGGWFAVLVIPIGGALAFVLLRRPWTAAYFLAAQIVSAGIVQVLKRVFGRARPEDILILSDFGSYPSGHVAGAATLATILVVLFPRVAVIIAGAAWVVAMALSRTYLHAHWLSDTVGGALVGVGAALVTAAAFAVPLTRERVGRRVDAGTPDAASPTDTDQ